MGLFDFITKPIGAITGAAGGIVGSAASGFANAAGTPNTYHANPYGMTQGQWVQGDQGNSGNPLMSLVNGLANGHYQPGGVDPAVAAAFNYQDPNAQAYTQGAQTAQNQGAQAYAAQQGVQNQQGGLSALLQQSASGQGPSVAQMQLNQALDASQRNSSALASGAIAKGVNPALAYQMAQNANAGNSQQASADAAMQRVNEQLAGRQQLSQLLAQMSGANLQQQGLAGQQAANYYNMGQQGAQFGTQTQMSLQDLLSNNYNVAQQVNSGVAAGNSAQHGQLVGSLLGGAANIGAKAAGG